MYMYARAYAYRAYLYVYVRIRVRTRIRLRIRIRTRIHAHQIAIACNYKLIIRIRIHIPLAKKKLYVKLYMFGSHIYSQYIMRSSTSFKDQLDRGVDLIQIALIGVWVVVKRFLRGLALFERTQKKYGR